VQRPLIRIFPISPGLAPFYPERFLKLLSMEKVVSPFSLVDVSSLSKRVGPSAEPARLHARSISLKSAAWPLVEYAARQRGLLAELGMGVGCALFSMGVLVGIYLLLDSL
jgi:hypothetical protein